MDGQLAHVAVGDGPIVGLVHGFAQNGRCWGPLAQALTLEHQVISVDAPGHGGSAMFGNADLSHGADLIAATIGTGTYIGYSMGARFVLHAALAHPDQVQRLVLISGTAGIDDPTERAQRRADDEARATHLEAVGLDAFLAEWVRLPLFADLDIESLDLDERRRNTAAGLAASLRHAGTGTMEPLWDRLAEIIAPTLVIAGALDEVYVAHAQRLAATITGPTTVAIIDGALHTPHRSQPVAVAGAVGDWLRSTAADDPCLTEA